MRVQCLEESVLYAAKRRTFGKNLIEHPVIRWKVAEMARQVEATHAYLEQITLQMNNMPELVRPFAATRPASVIRLIRNGVSGGTPAHTAVSRHPPNPSNTIVAPTRTPR